MKQETITTAQNLTAGLTVGGGSMTWLTQNATAVTALMTVLTGVVFAACAIANMMINRKNAKANIERNRINKRDIVNNVLEDLSGELSEEELKKVKDSLRKN